MIKPEEKEIDGLTFTTVQFPAYHGLGLFMRLAKALGPAMTALGGVEDPENVDLTELAAPLRDALISLEPEEMQKLVLEMLRQTKVWLPDMSAAGGRYVQFTSTGNIDEVFTGRLKTLFKVVGFSAKVNFSDFVGGEKPASPPKPATP